MERIVVMLQEFFAILPDLFESLLVRYPYPVNAVVSVLWGVAAATIVVAMIFFVLKRRERKEWLNEVRNMLGKKSDVSSHWFLSVPRVGIHAERHPELRRTFCVAQNGMNIVVNNGMGCPRIGFVTDLVIRSLRDEGYSSIKCRIPIRSLTAEEKIQRKARGESEDIVLQTAHFGKVILKEFPSFLDPQKMSAEGWGKWIQLLEEYLADSREKSRFSLCDEMLPGSLLADRAKKRQLFNSWYARRCTGSNKLILFAS